MDKQERDAVAQALCRCRRLATEAAAQQAAEAAQQLAGVQQATAQAANPIYLRPNEAHTPNGAPAAPAAPVPVAT